VQETGRKVEHVIPTRGEHFNWRQNGRALVSLMAAELEKIDAEDLKERADELRRFL
jgi:hypothetical protein